MNTKEKPLLNLTSNEVIDNYLALPHALRTIILLSLYALAVLVLCTKLSIILSAWMENTSNIGFILIFALCLIVATLASEPLGIIKKISSLMERNQPGWKIGFWEDDESGMQNQVFKNRSEYIGKTNLTLLYDLSCNEYPEIIGENIDLLNFSLKKLNRNEMIELLKYSMVPIIDRHSSELKIHGKDIFYLIKYLNQIKATTWIWLIIGLYELVESQNIATDNAVEFLVKRRRRGAISDKEASLKNRLLQSLTKPGNPSQSKWLEKWNHEINPPVIMEE